MQNAQEENSALFSFQGVIGRKAYLMNYVWIVCTGIVLALIYIYVASLTFRSDNVQDPVTGALTIPSILFLVCFALVFAYFFVAGISLQVRRGRDIFHRPRPSGMIEIPIWLAFSLTGGFFVIGTLLLFVWPGMTAKREPTDLEAASLL